MARKESVARMKHGISIGAATSRGIRDGCLPGFHFWWQQLYLCHIPSGLLFLRAVWRLSCRLCSARGWPLATRQVGRGFRRMVRFQEKCRLDERGISASAATRSVIRQTTDNVRYFTFGRTALGRPLALGDPGRCAFGGSIPHRATLPYGLTAADAGMACIFDAVVNEPKPAKWFTSQG